MTQQMWEAFEARDRSADGRFVVAVKTTRIYCKPSCAARRPKRENVSFFADGASAAAQGYRACLRCKPDDAARDREAVAKAARLIEQAPAAPGLTELAKAVGYAPHHFQRLFTREMGVSPAVYARGLRSARAQQALRENETVTDAIYEAGYSGPARFYADAKARLGMAPSAWRNGGRGETIRWACVDSALGQMLVAATAKGICRLSFEEGPKDLARFFPNAEIIPDEGTIAPWVQAAVDAVDRPSAAGDIPIDVAGTAFQEAVWRELRRIPPGETRSYAQIAAAVGKPGAVRAAGSANGANHVAVLIPCHRVVRSDGSLGGYAYGLERKRKLLEGENPAAQLSLQTGPAHS